jgi:serine/threonine protein kinase
MSPEKLKPNPPDLQPPPAVPEHDLLRLIGRGSSGDVWLARNTIGAYRAVKIVWAANFSQLSSFQRELDGVLRFEPVSRLHDGLVDILQVGGGPAASYFYCVMELADDVVTGQTIEPARYRPRTLAHDLTRGRRLPIGECIRLGAPLASALGFLHRHSLLHRDIKPANIIFVNGFPKLADMGLVADLSGTRSQVGTQGFIAPEGAGTPQADVYSLGKVLYEASTGKDRQAYPELPADLGDSAEDRDLVKFVRLVIETCRANPRRRCQSAEELLTALLAFEFSTQSPRRVKTQRFAARAVTWFGLSVAACVIAYILWRLIWILSQEHQAFS